MSDLAIDRNDLWALPFFMIGTLTNMGWLDFTVPLTDFALSDVLWTVSADGYTTPITAGLVITLLSLAWVMWTNDLGWRGWTGLQLWVILGTIWMVISPPFVPLMHALLMGSELAKVLAFTLQTVGFSTVSYLG